jgi:hypothetical protein
MRERFDFLLRYGAVVNHDDVGVRDIGVRGSIAPIQQAGHGNRGLIGSTQDTLLYAWSNKPSR